MLVKGFHSVYFQYSLFQSRQQRVRIGFCQNYHPSRQHLHIASVPKTGRNKGAKIREYMQQKPALGPIHSEKRFKSWDFWSNHYLSGVSCCQSQLCTTLQGAWSVEGRLQQGTLLLYPRAYSVIQAVTSTARPISHQ